MTENQKVVQKSEVLKEQNQQMPPVDKKKDVMAKRNAKQKKAKKSQSKFRIWMKDIVLGVINICLIFGLVFLLRKLPQKAEELKEIRANSISASSVDDVSLLKFDIENNSENIAKISKVFPKDEEGLLEFVSQLEEVKSQSNVMEGFTFASKDPVLDSSKNVGIPIIIRFRGSWEEIGSDIRKIQMIPFLFRPLTFDGFENQDEQIVEVKYGGFLYVDKNYKRD